MHPRSASTPNRAVNFVSPFGAILVRPAALALLTFVSAQGCKSGDSTPPPTPAAAPAATAEALPSPAVPTPAVPKLSKWEIDPENSSVGFVVKHVLTNVRGMFNLPKATIVLDDANPANSKVNATLEVKNISTGVAERDTHLQSADFFDAAKFPQITFVSTTFTQTSPTTATVAGNVTMHGVTKPATLAVTMPPPFNHAGGIRRGVEATMTVNRRDFDLKWDFPGEGTGVVVGDTIKITIDAEMVLQDGAPN